MFTQGVSLQSSSMNKGVLPAGQAASGIPLGAECETHRLFGAWGAGTAPGENPEPVLGFKKLGAPLEHRRESLFGPEDRGHIRASAAGH